MEPSSESRHELSFIRLLDSSEEKVLDSIATTYEDSFCLEEFGDLVRAHAALQKPSGDPRCFIIARVQTWDHKQPDREFYSYYNAYHLNKILFQTQVYLGKKLIHRIHVLNPLTNTDIIGNVLYFIVKPRVAGSGVPTVTASMGDITKSVVMQSEDLNPERLLPGWDEEHGRRSSKTSQSGKGSSRNVGATLPPLETRRVSFKSSHNSAGPLSAHLAEEEGNIQHSWTMSTQSATLLQEDEDHASGGNISSMSTTAMLPIRTAARRMSVKAANTARKLSSVFSPRNFEPISEGNVSSASNVPGRPTSAPQLQFLGDAAHSVNRSRTMSLDVYKPMPMGSPVDSKKRMSVSQVEVTRSITDYGACNVIMKSPTVPIQVNNHRRNKTEIPAGTVTRFAVPVSQTELVKVAPPTPKSRRRALSYNNSKKATPFHEWARQVHQAEVTEREKQSKEGNQLLTISTTITVPAKDRPALVTVYSDQQLDVTAESGDPTVPPTKNIETLYMYDAVLFATDNDFLEMSKIRTIFRENAQSPDEAKVFEMAPYTGSEESPLVVFIDDGPLCDQCYPNPAQLADMSPAMRVPI